MVVKWFISRYFATVFFMRYNYNFFDKYIKYGEGSAICRIAGIKDCQLSSWRRGAMIRGDNIKKIIKAIAIYKDLNFSELIVEYFKTI